ncbi:hypothetical protein MVEN_02561200 [Mycena venus]|uniref:Uncharacterized protein n=1 Tax=Mycena venus TaxID=2733690 RepID=A0A8H6U283_9AGAR|nr:hypothetical protein MVEN_02561200 [Mycena venus]
MELTVEITMCDAILADLYLEEGQISTAKTLFKTCLTVCNYSEIKSYCLERLGNTGRWGATGQMFSWTAVYLSHSIKYKENLGIYKALQFLGDIFLAQADEETAVSLFIIALEGFTFMDVHHSRAECMLRLGDTSMGHGDLLKAVELWETAKPLFERSSQAKQVADIDESNRAKPSFGGKNDFFEKIDSLPGGVKWQCKVLDIKGDLPDLKKDPTGDTMRREQVELWWRDPVECVKELLGNPVFCNVMRYAPEKLYADRGETIEVVNEMWTASWWWEIQKRLPPGATIAPLILSSDKTMLSNFRGDNSAWPVYLTVGNIGKETRRQVYSHATVLIGYLPIPKFDCFDKNTRSLAKYRLFHQCMTVIMQSIIEAGKSGVPMVCADSMTHLVWPIFAAYVADYPEQCLISCCKENRCPICRVKPNERGDHQEHQLRDMRETLYLMQRQQKGEKDSAFEDDGIRAVYPPFWANLPHSDIFQSFTPDLLHQLHKGVFKDHLVSWCTEIIGKLEIDKRFREMPDHHGVCHFKNGITSVSQWTGTEHKEMEKVFLGLIGAGAHPQMVAAVRGLIDFAYFVSLESHTSITLAGMRDALNTFHANKQIFIELKGCSNHFNIPKIHSLDHYETPWSF